MEEDLIDTLKLIHETANDEEYSAEEALEFIMELVELTLDHAKNGQGQFVEVTLSHGSSLDDDEDE